MFALNYPDFNICPIFTLYMHSSIETAPLEQSDHYSWRYCISFKYLGDTSVISQCSFGVNLVIDFFLYLVSDISPLYKI